MIKKQYVNQYKLPEHLAYLQNQQIHKLQKNRTVKTWLTSTLKLMN